MEKVEEDKLREEYGGKIKFGGLEISAYFEKNKISYIVEHTCDRYPNVGGEFVPEYLLTIVTTGNSSMQFSFYDKGKRSRFINDYLM